jgi:acyl transferase domain-containing protein
VAVVGMAGRFPGAADVEQFWENLRDGVEAISFFTDDELLACGVDAELLKSPNYVRARGVLPQPEWFDASFFGFSPREAEIIDPQLRAYLENCWEALEDAGYDPDSYEGLIGIYGGMSAGQYVLYNLLPDRELVASVGAVQLRLFNDKDFLTPLVAYKLNLKGPTINVQTACSTSLVTVHLACQSLLSYQCDLALAGGVSVNVPPKSGYVPVEGVFSPDGHCRAFDADAQGTVSGAGVGNMVLKRLSEALADGDTIHAVIRGSAINNDGALRIGYSAPSVDGQSEVIAMAQAVAGVAPESITYVEAHGTGTPLGDPIEVAALSRVFSADTDKKGFCGLGSVKTSIGHADAAAGVASLIKTVLALKHRQLPPSLNFSRPNPQIDFSDTPFFVNERLREWEVEGGVRRAGVSSFAMGGTNAHVIVEEAPAAAPHAPSRPLQLILLSAKTETALEAATDRLAAHLRRHAELDPADVAYTLQVGRRAFRYRRAVVCRDAGDLTDALEQKDARRLFTAEAGSGGGGVAFMFPGLGNHYVDMGRELYRHEPFFREQLDHCCELLRSHLGTDLRDIMFAGRGAADDETEVAPTGGRGLDLRRMLRGEDGEDEAARRLNQTLFSQPALFVIEYALARLWMKWGVVPEALIGYSIGEYAAACLAGVFSLEDALMLVARRAQLIQQLPSGSMLAVPLPVSEVEPLLGARLDLAAVNGPSVCVVSGETQAVDELERTLVARGVAARRIPTTHAFHSRMIEPIVESFTSLLKTVKLNPPAVPLISNVNGDWLSAAQATDPRYWATHLCRPVRFGDGIERLWKERGSVLLEVGPGQTLGAWALQHPESLRVEGRVVLSSLRHSYDRQSDLAFLLNTLGRLWLAGVAVDWSQFHAGLPRRRVPLPTYPFERRRCWVEPRKQTATAPSAAATTHLTKRPDIADWFYLPAWKQTAPPVAFAPEESAERAESASRHLIFLDECGVGEDLAARLEGAGREVLTVRRGAGFRQLGERRFAVAPDQARDYEALLGELRSRQLLPQVICHLWGVTPGADDETPEAHLADGFFSLLFLAQALGNRNSSDSLRLVVVGSGAQAVSGDELSCPAKAAALGACRVIPQEYANIFCRSIDIDAPHDSAARVAALGEQLLDELSAESADTLVAYRGRRRWVLGYDPVRVEDTGGARSLLREGGVYLITGGLGGIGLTIAEHLARTLRARLVLVGRSPMPEPGAWDAWLAERGEGDPISQKIRRLRSLEACGAEVLALSADVTSRTRMESVVAEARARFGGIDGVLHAAGVPPGGMIQMKTTEAATAVLAPKVRGTLVLDAVMRDEKPDFIALCSSLNAIFGGFGLVDHCAANAFLDAFAEAHAARTGTQVFSINWDGWLEVGQAANAALSAGLQGMLNASRLQDEDRHPLLDEVLLDEPDKQIHSTRISSASHWPVAEHRLMGRGIMPGTGYLELVRAAFAERAAGPSVVFSKVVFMSPLVFEDGEVKEVRVTFTKNKGAYDFSVTSGLAAGEGQAWQEHARGKVSAPAPAPAPPHPLAETLDRIEPQDLDSLGRTRRARQDDAPQDAGQANSFKKDDRNFGPRWQNLLKRVGLKEGEAIAYLELPEEFAGDLKHYALHPSLMDAAVGFAQIAGEGFYLPLAYKSITVHAPLTPKLFSYAKYPDGDASNGEVLVCDLLLMDEQGNRLVEIEEYTLRRISSAAALEGAAKTATGAASETRPASGNVEAVARPDGAKSTALLTQGILPEEGAKVFDRLLRSGLRVARVAVATRDLHGMMEQSRALTGTRLLEQINKLQTRRQKHPRPNLVVPYVAPRSETERRLAELWQEVLGIGEVGVHDSFFDMGGDSLLATLLVGRIGEAFGGDLSLRTMFDAPTPAEMAVAIVRQQARQVDAQALTDILGAIKNLSAEEIQAMLDAERDAERQTAG